MFPSLLRKFCQVSYPVDIPPAGLPSQRVEPDIFLQSWFPCGHPPIDRNNSFLLLCSEIQWATISWKSSVFSWQYQHLNLAWRSIQVFLFNKIILRKTDRPLFIYLRSVILLSLKLWKYFWLAPSCDEDSYRRFKTHFRTKIYLKTTLALWKSCADVLSHEGRTFLAALKTEMLTFLATRGGRSQPLWKREMRTFLATRGERSQPFWKR